jgi:hypothetical protein
LFCFAASIITEPLRLPGAGVASSLAGASGSAIHRTTYRNKFKPPRKKKANTQRIRINLVSMPKCSAKPPQIPAIFLFVRERSSRFVPLACTAPVPA